MNDISQQIAERRREYLSEPLTDSSVDRDPMAQFGNWFQEILRVEQPDPEAMTLSTATPDGRVSGRVVLLKGFDEQGFVFFSNYQSRKGNEIESNPYAALTFYWFSLNRQVRIEGRVERVSARESAEYFQTRPYGSQLGAWASPQSREIQSREMLETRLAEIDQRFKAEQIFCPPFWGGYRVRPLALEFWQGRENRLHDRILYTLNEGHWRITRLAP